jgi:hypothetical protein
MTLMHLLRTGLSSITSLLPHINLFQQIRWTRQEHKSSIIRLMNVLLEFKLSIMIQSQLPFSGYVLLSDALSTIISDDEATLLML